MAGAEGETAQVSSVFKWFVDDFESSGGVARFVRAKSDPATRASITKLSDDGLSYLDYDWSLNDRARAK